MFSCGCQFEESTSQPSAFYYVTRERPFRIWAVFNTFVLDYIMQIRGATTESSFVSGVRVGQFLSCCVSFCFRFNQLLFFFLLFISSVFRCRRSLCVLRYASIWATSALPFSIPEFRRVASRRGSTSCMVITDLEPTVSTFSLSLSFLLLFLPVVTTQIVGQD